jgi:prophage regulatory protein
VSAKERISTGCCDQGALRLKYRRPNEHSAMSAKPATQTVRPALTGSHVASGVQGNIVLAASILEPSKHAQAASAADKLMAAQPILLRLPTVMRITGLARSTIYKLISQNQFPVPIRLSKRAVAWLHCEIENWVSSRVRTH